jgi:hypothetical protein
MRKLKGKIKKNPKVNEGTREKITRKTNRMIEANSASKHACHYENLLRELAFNHQ